MPRYVDVDKLPKNRGILDTGFTGKMPIRFIDMDDIEKAPTADVVEVRRGEWVGGRFDNYSGYYEEQCSNCKKFSREYTRPYCPNCGAEMKGGIYND